MSRTTPMVKDGKSADVHPDEVENFKLGGWTLSTPKVKSAATGNKSKSAPAAPKPSTSDE